MECLYKNTISSYSQHPLCSVFLPTYVINSSFLNSDFHGQLESLFPHLNCAVLRTFSPVFVSISYPLRLNCHHPEEHPLTILF